MTALWLPQGARVRRRVDLTPEEMAMVRAFARLAQREGWWVQCCQCDGDVRGANAETDRIHRIGCQCREWVAEAGGRVPVRA